MYTNRRNEHKWLWLEAWSLTYEYQVGQTRSIVEYCHNHIQMQCRRVRFWTAKSSKKSAFFRTKKSAFAKRSALESAFFSAKKVFSYRKG